MRQRIIVSADLALFWSPDRMRCPRCDTSNTGSATTCDACGPVLHAGQVSYTPPHLSRTILNLPTAVEGERKQVTVLFCDVVGSTGLAERLGAERMHALLESFFAISMAEVHRYEGTINQFLGDGFMALFGA